MVLPTQTDTTNKKDAMLQQKSSVGSFENFDTVEHGLSPLNDKLLRRLSEERRAVTFDEVTLEDRPVEFHPNDVDLSSFVTRNIKLKGCGIISAAMDTVTEKEMCLAMAQMGGMGILHRNLSAEEQLHELNWVRYKINYGGMIEDPITFCPNDYASSIQASIVKHNWTFTSFPVVEETTGKLVGMITRNEMEFCEDHNPQLKEIMIPREQVYTTTVDDEKSPYQKMKESKKKKLPVVDQNDVLQGMYVWNDAQKDRNKRENFSLDNEGHYLCGAAIGVGPDDVEQRATLLVEQGNCKVLVIDSSHGSCRPVKDQLVRIREKFGNRVDVICGNIASYESAMYLLKGDAKPDALKVGIGPGSICTTRIVTGHGVPQLTAIFEVHRAVMDYGRETGFYVPIIADGGVRTSGDIVKCLAAGASSIMLGSVLAGTYESPGQIINKNGKLYKTIRGMGSKSAMEERSGSRGRYHRQGETHQTEHLTKKQAEKMVPEGVEGIVQVTGDVEHMLRQLHGGIQAGLAHTGALTIPEFHKRAQFWIQSTAGIAEGRPHDISDIRH